WGGREALGLVAIVGALAFDGAGVFALVSALLVFAGYLNFAHSPAWSPYYVEVQTVLSFATALGLCGVLASLLALRSAGVEAKGRRSRAARAVLAELFGLAGVAQLPDARAARRSEADYQASFQARVAGLPEDRTIVFV